MLDKILENIAVLLLEIIGYISAPIYFLIVLSFITDDLFNQLAFISKINPVILIIGIYGLGYLFRSMSMSIGEKGPFEIKRKVVKEIESTEAYRIVKSEFATRVSIIEEKLSFNDIRNMELSKHPEIADKAYLFMFRSNFFLDILVINLLFAVFITLYYSLGLIITLGLEIRLPFQLVFFNSFSVLIAILLLAKPLWNARRIFFKMSYSIPITHYLGKEKL